jgi:energy-coupling factor transport system ATP-binding protein
MSVEPAPGALVAAPMSIVIEDVHFAYPSGVEALRGVSLSIAPGEQVAIIGQNGSGKTTLVKHLNGLLRPARGMVRIGEWQTSDRSVAQLAARVGYVFQNPDDQLFKTRVEDEVRVGPLNLKLPPAQVESQVQRALALLDLTDKATMHPYDLSSTWRKRVAIAAVLAMATPILVLDEPTTGQDDRSLRQLGRVLSTLAAEGRTVIVISHDMDFVAAYCARIVVMGGGEVLADGPVEAVFAQEEMLAGASVEPPQLARLAARLALDGADHTVEGFLAALAAKAAAQRA